MLESRGGVSKAESQHGLVKVSKMMLQIPRESGIRYVVGNQQNNKLSCTSGLVSAPVTPPSPSLTAP